MKVGDLVRVKDGSGYYEEGEDTPGLWPESSGHVSIVLGLRQRSSYYSHFTYRTAVTINVLGEVAEFAKN